MYVIVVEHISAAEERSQEDTRAVQLNKSPFSTWVREHYSGQIGVSFRLDLQHVLLGNEKAYECRKVGYHKLLQRGRHHQNSPSSGNDCKYGVNMLYRLRNSTVSTTKKYILINILLYIRICVKYMCIFIHIHTYICIYEYYDIVHKFDPSNMKYIEETYIYKNKHHYV